MLLACLASAPARAQFNALARTGEFELGETLQLDRADNVVLGNLEQAKAYLADHQWRAAVDTLRQVMESSGGMLLAVTPQRYVSVRDYCNLQLANLPPEALGIYRSLVDGLARKWYEEGVARLDRGLLQNVVQQAFASSVGDAALLALGDLALESGDTAAARAYWEKILPAQSPPGAPRTWLCYPDTHLDLAAVRARLVLASILEGSPVRARDELAQYVRLHDGARGRLGGVDVNYAEALHELLAQSANWPAPPADADWPTFAGAPRREKCLSAAPDVGNVAWRVALREPEAAQPASNRATAVPRQAAAPGVHPVLVGQQVFVASGWEILGLKLADGRPAWGSGSAAFYRDVEEPTSAASLPPDALGTPCHTLTVADGKLYARMGSAVTSYPQGQSLAVRGGSLVCRDLEAEGRAVWEIAAEAGFAFEGAPLAHAGQVFVALRRSDIHPQCHVACYDAQSGQLRWRRFVCAAETPARGMLPECTHNLLTLQGNTLYCNTNLGAIAALSAADGQVQWISLYPRDRQGDVFHLAAHWGRALNPCLYHRGTLYVAPADSPRIFALDAATGQFLWQTGTEVDDVLHLLAVTDDHLLAAGGRMYWIGIRGAAAGRVARFWPASNARPGYGRGLVAGGMLYFPTRDTIEVFDARTAQPRKTFDLAPRGLHGGNLLAAGEYLLLTTHEELIALGSRVPRKEESPQNNPLAATTNRARGSRPLGTPGNATALATR